MEVYFIGLLIVLIFLLILRIRKLERKLNTFDEWAEWIEKEIFERENEMVFYLNFDGKEEEHDDENQ